MTWKKVEPGAIFGVPLLRGGFAFGYVTARPPLHPSFALVNIVEGFTPGRTPPSDVEARRVVVFDLLITNPTSFGLSSVGRESWFLTGGRCAEPILPRDRHATLGAPASLRVDMLGLEPDRRVKGSAAKHQELRMGGGLSKTAAAEIAVQGLATTPFNSITAFLNDSAAGARPAAAKADPFRPFRMVAASDDGPCSLVWSDGEFLGREKLFEAVDVACNGHTWAAIVRNLIEESLPDLDGWELDPEAGMLAIRAPKSELKKIARAFRALLDDRKALKRAIARAGNE